MRRQLILATITYAMVSSAAAGEPRDPFVPVDNGKPVVMSTGDEQTVGKPIVTSERRSAVTLSNEEAEQYFPGFDSEREIVIGNFRHNKRWYVAKIPFAHVRSIHYIDDVLDSYIRGRHGAYRFQFSQDQPVRLVPQVKGDVYKDQEISLDSVVFNLLATGTEGYEFSAKASEAGNIVGALQFQSVPEHVRRALSSLKLKGPARSPIHKLEMWEFDLNLVTPDETRLILMEAARQADAAFRGNGYIPYRLRCENCVNVLFDVAMAAVPRFRSALGNLCGAAQDMVRAYGLFATTIFKMRGMSSPITFPTNIQRLPHLNQHLPRRLRQELGIE